MWHMCAYFCEDMTELSWVLGPGTISLKCLHKNACFSWSNRIQRNYKGLKIITSTSSRSKLWTTRCIKAKMQLLLLREQKQSPTQDICIAYLLGYLSTLTQWFTPTLKLFKGPAHPTSDSKQGNLSLFCIC